MVTAVFQMTIFLFIVNLTAQTDAAIINTTRNKTPELKGSPKPLTNNLSKMNAKRGIPGIITY